MCLPLFSCFVEALPYVCIVTIPVFGCFGGIDIILRISLLLLLYIVVSELIPSFLFYVVPYLRIGVLVVIVLYLPVKWIPYPVIWLYDKLLWVSDPVFLVIEVVLALNFVMHCSRQCVEKIDEEEETAWKWKLLLTLFSAACYSVVVTLVLVVYKEGSDIQFWMLLLVLCFSMMLAAHNMMWMSHEGIVSDVAFVTMCSIFIVYNMKEEVTAMRKPLSKPHSWYSVPGEGSLLAVSQRLFYTTIENAHLAMRYLKLLFNPLFLGMLVVRMYSMLFLVEKIINNFGLEDEDKYMEELQSHSSPWHSPLIMKFSIIFMITQSIVKLFYQSSGLKGAPTWWAHILNLFWPQDLLFGRLLQIVVLNLFYIWRLYCADQWQWSDWFSA